MASSNLRAWASKASKKRALSKGQENYRLTITEDNMELILDCVVNPGELDDLIDSILEECAENKIKNGLSREELRKKLWKEGAKGQYPMCVTLAQGTKPTASEDGWIKWAGDFFKTGFMKDPKTGQMDYRRRAAQLNVTEGQLLAHVVRPEKGRDGRDIFGRPVSAKMGKVPRINLGTNVRHDPEEGAYYARRGGRFRWVNQVLSVDTVYTIKGSVGLKTGHITHNGSVVVEGDVLEGSRIEAIGDIEVHGMIESAEIQTSGNLTVEGGICRVEDVNVIVEGEVRAKFILDSDFRAPGPIYVDREIVNSVLKTRGAVHIPEGRIVGGEIMAHQGITVGKAGTRASVPTVLHAGRDYGLPGEVFARQQMIREAEKELAKLRQVVDALMPFRSNLSTDKVQELKEIKGKVSEKEHTIQELNMELGEVRMESHRRAKPFIMVGKMLHADTVVCIGNKKLIIKEDHSGPVGLAVSDGEIKLSSKKTTF
jgi:uncharacterized protein (DUF342 family)